jgi:hypothetical protein
VHLGKFGEFGKFDNFYNFGECRLDCLIHIKYVLCIKQHTLSCMIVCTLASKVLATFAKLANITSMLVQSFAKLENIPSTFVCSFAKLANSANV